MNTFGDKVVILDFFTVILIMVWTKTKKEDELRTHEMKRQKQHARIDIGIPQC